MDYTTDLFLVLPYLQTSGRVYISGVEFRSSTDLDGLAPDVKEHLRTICGMFYIQDAVRIERMLCAHVKLPPLGESRDTVDRRIRDAHLLIAFLYSRPTYHDDLLPPFEASSLFRFEITEFGPGSVFERLVWYNCDTGGRLTRLDSRMCEHGENVGYRCNRNFEVDFWVAEGSHIFPEIQQMHLPHQDVAADVSSYLSDKGKWGWDRVFAPLWPGLEQFRQRLFTALQWYSRSCRAGILEEEAIVHLAIALESLLNIREGDDKDRVTDRFKHAALALRGPVPRLEDWLEQFYNARSGAVHRGYASDLMYVRVWETKSEKGKAERRRLPSVRLFDYGRRVFGLCVDAMVSAACRVHDEHLEQPLVHNQERVDRVYQCLSERNVIADERLLNVSQAVFELSQRRLRGYPDPDVDPVLVLRAARQMIMTVSESTCQLHENTRQLIEDYQKNEPGSEGAKFEKLEEIRQSLLREPRPKDRNASVLLTGAIVFLQYATESGFEREYQYAEWRAEAKSDGHE